MKKLSKIDESTWGDILDRGSGDTVRKEDDVNHFEFYDFVHYLEEKYPSKNRGTGIVSGQSIKNKNILYLSIPIKRFDNKTQWLRIEVDKETLKYTGNIEVSKSLHTEYEYTLFSKKILGKKYKILYNFRFEDYILRPIDGEITNSSIVELIDMFLHNVDNPLLNIDVNESTWGGILDRGAGDAIRKEDLPEQNKEHWWRNIELPNVPKYKKDELKALDLMYDFAVDKIRKRFNVSWPYQIVFHFDGEPYWDLNIEHITPRGYDTFAMYAHGPRAPWQIYFSDMSMGEKRSIRYRLEKKKFYVYPYKYGDGRVEYHLREQSTYNNEKGIELK